MPQWTLLLTAMVFIHHASAAPTAGNAYRTQSQATCIECMKGSTSNDSLKRFIMEMNNITDGAIHVDGILSNKTIYAPDCKNFVDDGEFQKLGDAVIKEVNRSENARLYQGTSDLIRTCPNYEKMSKKEKDGMWVLFAASWAQKENGCETSQNEQLGPRRKDGSKRGILSGILRLDKNKEDQYTYGKLCQKGDSLTPEKSLRCGFSMLTGLIEKRQPLFSNGSYWEVLRPNAKVHKHHSMNGANMIKASLRKYPPCSGKPATKVASAKRKSKNLIAQK